MNDSYTLLGRISKVASYMLLSYWGLYALVAPVTNIDAQMYNIARVELASRAGYFGNQLFTSVYHVMWPWSFDALHLPFLNLGWGYALPSFACLVGICLVVQILMNSKFGPNAAWLSVLGVLGLTCLVYQGTSTKNDIPVFFCGAIWVYARWRQQKEQKSIYLIWAILATGLMAGAKTTGALYALILSVCTLWGLRHKRTLFTITLGGLAGSFILLGSVETYIESFIRYGSPLGPPEVVREHGNPDGVAGGIANFTRHIAGGIYAGPVDTPFDSTGFSKLLSDTEVNLLRVVGLTNAGVRPKFKVQPLVLLQSGFEEFSGFGPIGTIALATMLVTCLYWRPKALWWQLGMAGLIGILILSFTVGYTNWQERYQIGWYAIAIVGSVCALSEGRLAKVKILQWAFMIVALVSAIAAPLLSFNRKPSDILKAIYKRDEFETACYPLVGKMRERLRVIRTENPDRRIFYVVCDDSIILPFIKDPKLDITLATQAQIKTFLDKKILAPGDFIFVDALSIPQKIPAVDEVTELNFYSKQMITQAIYQWPQQ